MTRGLFVKKGRSDSFETHAPKDRLSGVTAHLVSELANIVPEMDAKKMVATSEVRRAIEESAESIITKKKSNR